MDALKIYSNKPNKSKLSTSRSRFEFFITRDRLSKSSSLILTLANLSSRDSMFYFCNSLYHKSRIINKLNPNDRKYTKLHNTIGYGMENNMYDVWHHLNQLVGLVGWCSMCNLKEKSLFNTHKRSIDGRSFSSVCLDLFNTSFLIDEIEDNSRSMLGLQTYWYLESHVYRKRLFNKSISTRLNGKINPNLLKDIQK